MKTSFIKIGILFSILCMVVFHTKVEAATFGLSANKKEVTVGESFTVTISGIYGKVTISGNNVQLSTSGSYFIESRFSYDNSNNKECWNCNCNSYST